MTWVNDFASINEHKKWFEKTGQKLYFKTEIGNEKDGDWGAFETQKSRENVFFISIGLVSFTMG